MKKLLLTFFCFYIIINSFAFGDTTNIPIWRVTWHEEIGKQQLIFEKADGKQDGIVRAGNNDVINSQLTDALFRKPNEWRQWVETNDAQLPTNNDKVGYLKAIADALVYFRVGIREKELKLTDLPLFLESFEKTMKAKALTIIARSAIWHCKNKPTIAGRKK
jgi:hypothetical protein